METCFDFFDWLENDMSSTIFMCLEDPADLVRVSAVSRSWREFVIANGLSKQLCWRMFPQLSDVAHIVLSGKRKKNLEVGSSKSMEWETLEEHHRVYASLAHACTSFTAGFCISTAISASSTDNYPAESIDNTLEREDIVAQRASYWSSKGQSNPSVPETLTYKLVSKFCLVTEISIQPFQAYFQPGFPIYSANSVRFRMGHLKSLVDIESSPDCAQDDFVWTYISQEFPMAQESCLQKFKFPEPVLCIGGFLQIELLGRVQRQEMDGLFYICISHVQVMGRSLTPAFDVEIIGLSGKFLLKYHPDAPEDKQPSFPEDEPSASVTHVHLQRRLRVDMDHILNMLWGHIVDVDEYEWDNENNEEDEEFAA